MDWPRLVIIVQSVIVGGLFTVSSLRMWRQAHIARPLTPVQRSIAFGRVFRYMTVVLFCVATIEGSVELWSEHITPRIFFIEGALLAGMLGWVLVERGFPDEDMFKLRPYQGRDSA